MAGTCAHCGDRGVLRECNYCDDRHRSEHQLPESHNCIHIYKTETHGPDFRLFGEAILTARANNECLDCGQAIKRNRKRCFQCRARRRQAKGEREIARDRDDNLSDNLTRGANNCRDCGRATASSYDYCFRCRNTASDASGEKADKPSEQSGGLLKSLKPVLEQVFDYLR